MAANQINLPKGFVLDEKPDVNLPKGFVLDEKPYEPPSYLQQLKREFESGVQHDKERTKEYTKISKKFISGFQEKWPQIAASTLPLLLMAEPSPAGEIAVSGSAAWQAAQPVLKRLALSYFGGAAGKAAQEAYRAAIDSEKAPKDIWEATERVLKAGEEELIGQGIGEIGAAVVSKAIAPFASRVTPGTPELSKKLAVAGKRIPEEELLKMPPQLRKQFTAKTLFPRLYHDASGKLKFGRVTRLRDLLTPSQKTISPALDWVENATESSIFGGGRIKLEKQYMQPAALKQMTKETIDTFWDHVGRRLSNRETADLFVDAITDSKKMWRTQQRIAYRQIDKIMAETSPLQRNAAGRFVRYRTISLDKLNKMADGFLAEATSGAGSAPARKRVSNLIKKWYAENPNGIDFETAITYRSDLIEELAKTESILNLKSAKLRRVVDSFVAGLDSSMGQTAKNNSDDAYKAWRSANLMTKTGYEKFQTFNIESALRHAHKNPSKISDVFFQPYAAEGVQELKNMVPNSTFKTLRANWIEKQIRGAQDARGIIRWRAIKNNLSEEVLGKEMIKETFPETMTYRNLNDFMELASILQEKGGTGGGMVMQLTQAGQIVMAGVDITTGQAPKLGRLGVIILTPLQASRILTYRGGSKLLAEGFKTPVGAPEALGLASKLLIIANKGEEPLAPITSMIEFEKRKIAERNKAWLEEFRASGLKAHKERKEPENVFRIWFNASGRKMPY